MLVSSRQCLTESDMKTSLVLPVLVLLSLQQVQAGRKPNLLLVLADDLGVNDVSWNNPAVTWSPTLDKLARSGTILDTAYTLPVCSPSRAALLTGVLPYKFGFQRGFGKNIPEGIPLNIKLLPEYLSSVGYSTHAFGKWHLGFCSESYLPVNRGFHTFNGLYIGDQEDFSQERRNIEKGWKYLYKSNIEDDHDSMFDSLAYGDKISKLLLQQKDDKPFFIYFAPLTKVYPKKGKEKNVVSVRKKKIQELDQALELILETLKTTKQYDNTIIIFISDNGGRYIKSSSDADNPNFPLRGFKSTIYEGGTKVPAFISSPLFNRSNTRYSGLLHMVDLLPTVLGLAGHRPVTEVDGVDQWEAITSLGESPRSWLVYNIDDTMLPNFLRGSVTQQKFQIGIRNYRYKLIWGQPGMLYRGYRPPQYSQGGVQTDFQTIQLFDLMTDPGETRNLAARRTVITNKFLEKARELYASLVPPRFIVSQSVINVLDRGEEEGAVTGWCRATLETVCSQPPTEPVTTNLTHNIDVILYGTLDWQQPRYCLTKLET